MARTKMIDKKKMLCKKCGIITTPCNRVNGFCERCYRTDYARKRYRTDKEFRNRLRRNLIRWAVKQGKVDKPVDKSKAKSV